METGLAGKGVLVTGASGGIGAACARAFAAEAARVGVHYHRGEERRAPSPPSSAASPSPGRSHRRSRRRPAVRRRARRPRTRRRLRCRRRRVAFEDVPVWELPLERWESTLRANPHPRSWPRAASCARSSGTATARWSSSARPPASSGGRPRRLRSCQVRRARGPPALAEERDRPYRAARPRQRGRARLDGVAHDPRAPRPERRRAHHAYDGATEGRAARGRRRTRSSFLASDVLSGHVTGQVVTVAGGMEGRLLHES